MGDCMNEERDEALRLAKEAGFHPERWTRKEDLDRLFVLVALARAPAGGPSDCPTCFKAGYSQAQEDARASAAPQEPPPGWVMVPREPTIDMVVAMSARWITADGGSVNHSMECIYRAMLADAPQPQASPQEPVSQLALQECAANIAHLVRYVAMECSEFKDLALLKSQVARLQSLAAAPQAPSATSEK